MTRGLTFGEHLNIIPYLVCAEVNALTRLCGCAELSELSLLIFAIRLAQMSFHHFQTYGPANDMYLEERKPVLGLYDQVRLNQVCSAAEISKNIVILNGVSLALVLTKGTIIDLEKAAYEGHPIKNETFFIV